MNPDLRDQWLPKRLRMLARQTLHPAFWSRPRFIASPCSPTLALTLSLVLALGTGCAGSGETPGIPTDPQQLAEEIALLESRIESDRHALEDLVTQPKGESNPELHSNQTWREIADRLSVDTRLLEQLKELEVPGAQPTARP